MFPFCSASASASVASENQPYEKSLETAISEVRSGEEIENREDVRKPLVTRDS